METQHRKSIEQDEKYRRMYADVEEDLFSFFFKLRKYVSLLSKPLSIVPPIESQEKGKYRAGKNYAENTLCTYGERELGQTLLSRFSSGFGRTLITRKRSYGSTLVENPLARLPPGPGNFRERSVAINPPSLEVESISKVFPPLRYTLLRALLYCTIPDRKFSII